MPGIIDPDTTHVDDLPGIWSPVQWELTDDEKAQELKEQAKASLLWGVDNPETILRLFLNETDIERSFDAPEGYDPDIQGEWDDTLVTFVFKRAVKLMHVEREFNYLTVEYDVEDLCIWVIEIEPEKVTIEKI